MSQELIETTDEGVVTLAINRPEDKNMLSDNLLEELLKKVYALDNDNAVRVVVLTGTGNEFFCGGIFNPKMMSQLTHHQIRTRRQRANELFDRLESLTHPVIDAINGRAQAGGFEMVMACDMRVAAAHATFALPETSWGMFPGAGGPLRLPFLVGMGMAMDIIMTGRDVSAEEARRIGLVERAAGPNEFASAVQGLSRAIARTGLLGNRAVKKLVRATLRMDLKTARSYSDALRDTIAGTADSAEGIAAYCANRPPRFQGK